MFRRGASRTVVSMDIDPWRQPMIFAQNRSMRSVKLSRFGVGVYALPHVGPQGRRKSRERLDIDFGPTNDCRREFGGTLNYLYLPFLSQAQRVLKPEGLLPTVITVKVHNHLSQWEHCDFMQMAEAAGLKIRDLIVKVFSGLIKLSK